MALFSWCFTGPDRSHRNLLFTATGPVSLCLRSPITITQWWSDPSYLAGYNVELNFKPIATCMGTAYSSTVDDDSYLKSIYHIMGVEYLQITHAILYLEEIFTIFDYCIHSRR